MKLFWKLFLAAFVSFAIVVALVSYVVVHKEISEVEKSIADKNGVVGGVLAKEIEKDFVKAQWPFESLREISEHEDFLFWWVVTDDGKIHLADDATFMETHAHSYFPDIDVAGGEQVYLNRSQNYGVSVTPFTAGRETWFFWFGFSLAEVTEAVKEIVFWALEIFLFALVLLATILYFSISHFTKPICNLTAGVARVGKGDWSSRVTVQSSDEIGVLADSFNQMTDNLQRTTVSKDYLDTIIGSMMDALIVTDQKFTIRGVNKAAGELLNYEEEELIGKPLATFCASGEMASNLKRILQFGKEDGIKDFETTYKTKSGEEIPVLVSTSAVRAEDGSVSYIVITAKDITERKRAEAELRRSEERYRFLYEESHIFSLIISEEGDIVDFNKTSLDILGYSRDDVTGKNVLDFVLPEYREKVFRHLRMDFVNEYTPEAEFEVYAKDGSIHTILFSPGGVILYEDEQPIGLLVTGIDITARKVAEEAMRESEWKFRMLFEFAPDAYYLNDLKGHFIDGNKAAEKLLGYKKGELIGKSFLDLTILPPEQIPKAAALLAKNARGNATGPDEFILQRRDGTQVHVEILTFPITIKEQTVVLGIAHDITERKEAERKEQQYIQDLHSLSETAMGFVELSPDEDIYQSIAVELQKFAGNAIVIVTSFDEMVERFQILAVAGLETQMQSVEAILGRPFIGLPTPISAEAQQALNTGKLEKVCGGIYELACDGLPKNICTAIEELINFNEAYAMGFTWKERLFGSAIMLLPTGTELRNREIIETFVNQASIALQRWQTEKALRESEEKYRNLVERANDGITIIQDAVLVYANPRLAEMSGTPVEELIGTPFTDYIAREKLSEVIDHYQRRMAGEDVEQVYETLLRRRDGGILYVELNAGVIPYQGKLADLVIIRDITGRKKAEMALKKSKESFHNIVERSSDGFIVIDRSGLIHYINSALAFMFGRKKEELLGELFGIPIVESESTEIDIIRKGGGTGAGELRVSETEWAGKPAHLIAVRDVTERKQFIEQLEAALREKETLMREIHHRVKNNLQIVSSLLNLQAMKETERDVIASLLDSRSRIHTMALIHTQLYQSESLEEVDMDATIRRLVAFLLELYGKGEKGITYTVDSMSIKLHISRAIPCGLIINELVSNALKHAFKGREKGAIAVKMRALKDDTILLAVKDDGIGMPEGLGDVYKSDTLGLSLVRTLAEKQLKGIWGIKRNNGTEIYVEFKKAREE